MKRWAERGLIAAGGVLLGIVGSCVPDLIREDDYAAFAYPEGRHKPVVRAGTGYSSRGDCMSAGIAVNNNFMREKGCLKDGVYQRKTEECKLLEEAQDFDCMWDCGTIFPESPVACRGKLSFNDFRTRGR